MSLFRTAIAWVVRWFGAPQLAAPDPLDWPQVSADPAPRQAPAQGYRNSEPHALGACMDGTSRADNPEAA
jgi:hypothetical protein